MNKNGTSNLPYFVTFLPRCLRPPLGAGRDTVKKPLVDDQVKASVVEVGTTRIREPELATGIAIAKLLQHFLCICACMFRVVIRAVSRRPCSPSSVIGGVDMVVETRRAGDGLARVAAHPLSSSSP